MQEIIEGVLQNQEYATNEDLQLAVYGFVDPGNRQAIIDHIRNMRRRNYAPIETVVVYRRSKPDKVRVFSRHTKERAEH